MRPPSTPKGGHHEAPPSIGRKAQPATVSRACEAVEAVGHGFLTGAG
jgi:hypothetical protein